MMRWELVVCVLVGWSSTIVASPPENQSDRHGATGYRGKLVLFGAQREPARSGSVEILVMNPDGTGLESLLKLEDVGRVTGRISPDGRRLVFGTMGADGKRWETWILQPDGTRHQVPVEGVVRAWSPDDASLACFRMKAEREWESVLVEVETGRIRALPLPASDVIDDWSPDGKTLAVMAGNPGQTLDYPAKGIYPLRQIDVMGTDGSERRWITTDPLLDCIWSRFSPDGSRLAHEERRVDRETKKVFCSYVVRGRDGGHPVEIVRRDKLDEDLRLIDAYPSYPFYWGPGCIPCWSPDGSRLVVCINNLSWTRGHADTK